MKSIAVVFHDSFHSKLKVISIESRGSTFPEQEISLDSIPDPQSTLDK